MKKKLLFAAGILVFVAILITILVCGILYIRDNFDQIAESVARSIGILEQHGDTIIYNGTEYIIARDFADFIANVDLTGYRRVGYAKLNLFPYISVYAKPGDNPDHLVFNEGLRICFAEGCYPGLLTTEYSRILFKYSHDEMPTEYNNSMTLSDQVLPTPNAEPSDDAEGEMYVYCLLMLCYLQEPNNTYRLVNIYKQNETYYVEDMGDRLHGTDSQYYAIIDGSDLHKLILEALAAKEPSE